MSFFHFVILCKNQPSSDKHQDELPMQGGNEEDITPAAAVATGYAELSTK